MPTSRGSSNPGIEPRSLALKADFFVQSLGQEDSPGEGHAAHFRILVWRIPWKEEPGFLQSDKPS